MNRLIHRSEEETPPERGPRRPESIDRRLPGLPRGLIFLGVLRGVFQMVFQKGGDQDRLCGVQRERCDYLAQAAVALLLEVLGFGVLTAPRMGS